MLMPRELVGKVCLLRRGGLTTGQACRLIAKAYDIERLYIDMVVQDEMSDMVGGGHKRIRERARGRV